MGLLDRLLKRRPKALTVSMVEQVQVERAPMEPLTKVLSAVAPAAAHLPVLLARTAPQTASTAVEPSALVSVEDRREHRHAARQAHVADAQHRHEQELQGKGEGADAHAARGRTVRGKPYYLWVETIEQLKREARHEEVLALLYECIAAAERDRRGGAPAPAYTEHAAIVHRKMGDHDAEIAVIKRWLRLAPENEPKLARMSDRLTKASALQERKRVPS
ncbi:hypothetical protein [Quadrisphaera setariae]|uniref:Uncharacterized protein n=1 Tax=Quadrisphaera setariae TaxID=2593304 RepID=A0A5C8ZE36_9ACTN|nr:hypothetical protein [Quadrisphaera setariae]TXR55764.1 hypothetical protein FMM08_13150 [Quadrisphaera setariae]